MAVQIVREVNADVVKRGSTRAVYAKQHDLNSRFLNVRIQEDGKDLIIDPALTVVLNVARSDNVEGVFYGTVNEDGTVQVPLTSWMLELAGTLVCDISIISEDPAVAKLTTMQFNIYVEAAVVCDSSIVDAEEYSVIVDLLTRANAAEQAVAEATRQIKSAVYLGSETPPEDAVIWLDPAGSIENANILRVRNASGAWVGIPAIMGDFTDADREAVIAGVLANFTDASEVAM